MSMLWCEWDIKTIYIAKQYIGLTLGKRKKIQEKDVWERSFFVACTQNNWKCKLEFQLCKPSAEFANEEIAKELALRIRRCIEFYKLSYPVPETLGNVNKHRIMFLLEEIPSWFSNSSFFQLCRTTVKFMLSQ